MFYLQLQKLLPKKLTLTVVERQQLPDFEKAVSKEGISCCNCITVGEKYV